MRRALGSSEHGEDKGMPARGLEGKLEQIGCIALSFHILSWYMDDADSSDACIAGVSSDGDMCRVRIYDPKGCNGDSLEFVEEALPKALKAATPPLELECSEEPGDCMGFETISRRVAAEAVRLGRKLVEEYGEAMRKREIFVVVGWNGLLAVGEGEEERIRLPHIPSPIMMHSHPTGYCYPSYNDVVSMASFFADGGIVSGIVSENCISIFRLLRPLSEDDYWALQDIGKCIRESKDASEYMMCLTRVNTLKSLAYELY